MPITCEYFEGHNYKTKAVREGKLKNQDFPPCPWVYFEQDINIGM